MPLPANYLMKTNTKINKTLLLKLVLIASTASMSITDYAERSKTIHDIKAELTGVPLVQEKQKANQIVVQNDGIKYGDVFVPKTNNSEFKIITVRLTVYWAKGGGTDGDSAKMKSSTGYTLKQGESIAVDPRIIPYTREVIIPNVGLVKAVDTGTDVKRKTASHGKLPVIDVFFMHKKDAMLFANKYPKIVKVAVLN
ncbi:hypothetical protein EBR43_05790 [bacterium]|nr:hypothetical protein [bacterium]